MQNIYKHWHMLLLKFYNSILSILLHIFDIDLNTMVPFSDISKSWAQASWKVFEASMWVTGGPYTIKGWNILFVFQKIKLIQKYGKSKNCRKCKLYFFEIQDFLENILPIFPIFWPTVKKWAPTDQNWASSNKFTDKIREC